MAGPLRWLAWMAAVGIKINGDGVYFDHCRWVGWVNERADYFWILTLDGLAGWVGWIGLDWPGSAGIG